MYEVVRGGNQPQPWHYGIICAPQVTLTSQIWGQLGRWDNIREYPYALETAYQWLKHIVHVYYGCMKWFEVDVTLNHDVMASFPLLKWPWLYKPGTNLTRQCNGISVHPYALETAYQWLKQYVYNMSTSMDVWCGLRWTSASNMTLRHHLHSSRHPESPNLGPAWRE